MKPRTSYIVCATPRTGSGLLCEALWNTGLAGKPDEYFYPDTEMECTKAWGTSTYEEYLDAVMENATTPNGVFGAKIMWSHVDYFKKKVLAIARYSHLQTADFMSAIFPGLHYVWIRRRDKIRQAVSLWKLIQTGRNRWCEDEPPRETITPDFNFTAIDRLVRELSEWDSCWQTYFETLGVSPLTVVYEEDLERGDKGVMKRVLVYLAVAQTDDVTAQTRRKKQSDSLSETFVSLYLDMVQDQRRKNEPYHYL